ncbi:FKBP-type peptidyl-prolyl cis-trans isomerase [Pelagicoccus albus]|uniref:Peptidyl-prolyl cis-trans isomerase n=1 Tax=Pelagicoccus albus TaxID=415222 RepID=A0A7X1B7B1_9BACT|nr:FKBP-type peptidyl-prolyl cis-trans isomerase [Pelagicoccus albus]MBC2606729.1 FKBP-type peptidyl-prolyl cis-trans isomerase [Pelagicoccus albus]
MSGSTPVVISVCAFVASLIFIPYKSEAQETNLLLDYMPPAHAKQLEELMPGAEVLGGGVRFLELESGTGDLIEEGDRVEAIYTGRFLDGTIFNQKTGRFHTYHFEVGADPRQIIEGWEVGLPKMQNGGRYLLGIPSQLAYKDKGRRGQVPPFATVTFEIKILDVDYR